MFDFFAAGDQVSRQLTAEGYGATAELLNDSLACCSPTEAFMGMRWHLDNFLNTEPLLKDETRCAINELLQALRTALK